MENIELTLDWEEISHILYEDCLKLDLSETSSSRIQAYDRGMSDNRDAKDILLANTLDKIRNKMANKKHAQDIMDSLQLMLGLYRKQVWFDRILKFTSSKYNAGSGVREHILQMNKWMREADNLGSNLDYGTRVYMILNSLPEIFKGFIDYYLTNNVEFELRLLAFKFETYEKLNNIGDDKAKVTEKPSFEVKEPWRKVNPVNPSKLKGKGQ